MQRRMVVGGLIAAMLLVLVAGCGGSDASPSPSADGGAVQSEAPTEVPPSQASSEAPAETTSSGVGMTSLCAGVAIRKGPSTDDAVVGRVVKGTKVRVVETVPGASYEAGACGSSGSDWIKLDRVAGKSASTLYGVKYVYAAAGFFE